MAAETIDLGPTSLRSKLRVVALVAVVAVLVTSAVVLVQNIRAQVLSPGQARTALTRSFPDRDPAFGVGRPVATSTSGPVTPAGCQALVLRPWLVDAWPDGATAGSQTGTAGTGAYPAFDVVTFTFDQPRQADQVFAASRRLLDERGCAGAEIRGPAYGAAPFTVELEGQAPVEPTDPNCEVLAYQTTASDQSTFPHRIRTQLLRYGNTVSWQVQQSPDDYYQPVGSPVRVDDSEPPSLAGLCRQLRALGTSG